MGKNISILPLQFFIHYFFSILPCPPPSPRLKIRQFLKIPANLRIQKFSDMDLSLHPTSPAFGYTPYTHGHFSPYFQCYEKSKLIKVSSYPGVSTPQLPDRYALDQTP